MTLITDSINFDNKDKYLVDTDVDIKDIINKINRLSIKEKSHILNILKMANIKFTKNSNGYFFNFLDIKEDILAKICNCLDLIEKNAGILKEMDRRRNELLNYYKNLIEDRLQNNIKRRRIEYLSKLMVINHSLTINIKPKRNHNLKRIKSDTYVDPDVLLKEYKNRYKYEKGSVYHRIITCIKLLRSKRGRDIKSADDTNSNIMNYDNKEGEGDDNANDSEGDNTDDMMEDSLYSEHSDLDTDEKTDQEGDDTMLHNEKYIFDEDNENDNDNDNDDDEDKRTSEDKTENDFLFFKNLLNQQGFQFDDDKKCLLIYQNYIQ